MRTQLTDFQIEYRELAPISVRVPCSLISALAAIGEIPTPRAAGDDERIAEALSFGATFSACLTADALMLSNRYVFLRFYGLFAPAYIEIDGRRIADVPDRRAVTTVEIRGVLTPGEHRLTVVFPPKAKDGVFEGAFFDDMGIFRPAECIATDTAAIDRVGVCAETRGEETFFRVRAELLGEGRGVRAVAAVQSPAGQYFYAGLPDFEGEVNLRRATRWYPAGCGEAACYRLTVTLYHDAEAIDATELSVGVRAPISRTGAGAFAFSSDGIPFVPRGTAYLPISPLLAREAESHIRSRLEAAASAGINAFFVRDAGVFPPDVFYDLCDRLGIAVFQEVCADGASGEETACDFIARVAHHPAVLCFYTVSEDPALLERLNACVHRADPTLSCFSVKEPPLAAFPSLPAMSTLRTFLPADGWNCLSDAMLSSEEHAGDLVKILNAGFERYPYAGGMEKIVYLSGIVQADKMKEEILRRRAEEGVPAPLMFGSLADAKTRTSSSLIDAAGRKKAAWYAFRRATAPLALIPKTDGARLSLIASNISETPFRGTLTCLLCDAYNRVQKELTAELLLSPVSSAVALQADFSAEISGHEKEFYLSYFLTDGQNLVFSDTALFVVPRRFRFSYPDILYEIKGSGKDFVLTVSASAFVKYVKFDFQNIEVEWSDNYIDLTKEAPVRISFRTKSNTAAEALIRDFSYRSVYDLLHDEPHTFSRSHAEEDFLSEEQK